MALFDLQHRQVNAERSALSWLTVGRYGPAVIKRYLLADGQANACTSILVSAV
jgi:hypothetical protein